MTKEERIQKLIQLVFTVNKAKYEITRAYWGPGSKEKFKSLE